MRYTICYLRFNWPALQAENVALKAFIRDAYNNQQVKPQPHKVRTWRIQWDPAAEAR